MKNILKGIIFVSLFTMNGVLSSATPATTATCAGPGLSGLPSLANCDQMVDTGLNDYEAAASSAANGQMYSNGSLVNASFVSSSLATGLYSTGTVTGDDVLYATYIVVPEFKGPTTGLLDLQLDIAEEGNSFVRMLLGDGTHTYYFDLSSCGGTLDATGGCLLNLQLPVLLGTPFSILAESSSTMLGAGSYGSAGISGTLVVAPDDPVLLADPSTPGIPLSFANVPEPASFGLLGISLSGGLAFLFRRRAVR